MWRADDPELAGGQLQEWQIGTKMVWSVGQDGKPVGEWNAFRIRMIGERVSVWLNDVLVVDNTVLERMRVVNAELDEVGIRFSKASTDFDVQNVPTCFVQLRVHQPVVNLRARSVCSCASLRTECVIFEHLI